uniref:MFS domain-containing protein n=1 Tax=Macrostomum lignano TaxID=282301 RepID=A0A1I8FHR2_9PLAT
GLRETASARTRPGSPGICAPQCSNVYAYLVLFFCIRVVGTIAAVQFTLIMMNSREMKPLAMGSISFLFGLLGVITPPVAGRKLIDTVCIVENPSSTGDTASAAASRCRPACLFFLSYWLSRSRYPSGERRGHQAEAAASSEAAEAGGGTGEELQRLPTSG